MHSKWDREEETENELCLPVFWLAKDVKNLQSANQMGQLINMMYFVMVPELSKPNGTINKHDVLCDDTWTQQTKWDN